jgi:hypothetical protein
MLPINAGRALSLATGATEARPERSSALHAPSPTIVLSACDCTFEILCPDDQTAAIVTAAFSGLLVRSAACDPDVSRRYEIGRSATTGAYQVVDADDGEAVVENTGSLLFYLDKQITLALQERRPDLYFLHAAAIASSDRVAVLAAPSGTGKSTLTLAFLERRFTYLTDELTPIDPQDFLVHPYPRALSLKASLPERYRLQSDTVDAGNRFYVGLESFRVARRRPMPLAAIFFLERKRADGPACRVVSTATAAAYLVANALNSAAHPADGLDVALRLSGAVPCFALESSDLDSACSAVGAILSPRCG